MSSWFLLDKMSEKNTPKQHETSPPKKRRMKTKFYNYGDETKQCTTGTLKVKSWENIMLK